MSITSFRSFCPTARRAFLALTVVAVASSIWRANAADASVAVRTPGPTVLTSELADVIVRVEVGDTCSGTPLVGTNYVVTAAHCVLDAYGRPAQRTVIRDGVDYLASAVIVDLGYVEHPSAALDAAVIVLDRPLPGPGAVLAATLPTVGEVTVVGFQPIDADGTLLRGATVHQRPTRSDGRVSNSTRVAAGCERPARSLRSSDERVVIQCGLIPGSSGGGMLSMTDGVVTLSGIISTVSNDLHGNGLVPLSSLHTLLADAAQHTYAVSSHVAQAHQVCR